MVKIPNQMLRGENVIVIPPAEIPIAVEPPAGVPVSESTSSASGCCCSNDCFLNLLNSKSEHFVFKSCCGS